MTDNQITPRLKGQQIVWLEITQLGMDLRQPDAETAAVHHARK